MKNRYRFLIAAEHILCSGHKIKNKTYGASMYPVIRKDDMVTIRPCAFEDVKLSDIIARKNNNSGLIIVHRVIYKNKEKLIIRADISLMKRADQVVTKKDFLGILDKIERNGKSVNFQSKFYKYYGYLAVFLSRHFYFGLFIPACFVRIVTTPELFIKKAVWWFRLIFFKNRKNTKKRYR